MCIKGIRYIDVLLLLIQTKEKKNFKKKINNILKDVSGIYQNNSGVNLEIEESGGKVNFLENEISIYNKLEIDYINKNENSIKKENKQRIIRIKSYNSFEPQEQKIGIIIGFFIRIARLTTKEEDLLHAINYFLKELNLLKYPKNIIRNAIYKMKIKTGESVWETANYFLTY